ncbi:hypothetical protein V1477_013829 [Vespula maculifrons]|uniref:Uncharacterized protein n=1 Tax=Vespula maculifrons TaxID=7453 RepID=A0ABD2BPD5_VESMC
MSDKVYSNKTVGWRINITEDIDKINALIIKDYLPDSIINQPLECYGQAIGYNRYNLNVIKKAVCITIFHIIPMDDKQLQDFSSSDLEI